ncbi:hypothetical protein ACQKFO_14885 [Rossellomorea sp. NPDC071047]|uniref:hypothetical protein n=1 Tax=Rossellomorea sp. NPDC071047 TaxID=3390675 RepID=UPI003D03B520
MMQVSVKKIRHGGSINSNRDRLIISRIEKAEAGSIIVNRDQSPPDQDRIPCDNHSSSAIQPPDRPAIQSNSTFPAEKGQFYAKTTPGLNENWQNGHYSIDGLTVGGVSSFKLRRYPCTRYNTHEMYQVQQPPIVPGTNKLATPSPQTKKIPPITGEISSIDA